MPDISTDSHRKIHRYRFILPLILCLSFFLIFIPSFAVYANEGSSDTEYAIIDQGIWGEGSSWILYESGELCITLVGDSLYVDGQNQWSVYEEQGLITKYTISLGDTTNILFPTCDHDYILTDYLAATRDSNGQNTYTCSLCGDSYQVVTYYDGSEQSCDIDSDTETWYQLTANVDDQPITITFTDTDHVEIRLAVDVEYTLVKLSKKTSKLVKLKASKILKLLKKISSKSSKAAITTASLETEEDIEDATENVTTDLSEAAGTGEEEGIYEEEEICDEEEIYIEEIGIISSEECGIGILELEDEDGYTETLTFLFEEDASSDTTEVSEDKQDTDPVEATTETRAQSETTEASTDDTEADTNPAEASTSDTEADTTSCRSHHKDPTDNDPCPHNKLCC